MTTSARTTLLTVDDGPSEKTGEMVRWLSSRGIPALFFFRGDKMEQFPDAADEAIRAGFAIGNHLYAHKRASAVPPEETIADIARTEALIEAACARAEVTRTAKYLRFPHMDCGLGGWTLDYDRIDDPQDRETIEKFFAAGLNNTPSPPTPQMRRTHGALAAYLEKEDFSPLPCPAKPPRWFRHLAAERSAPFTFSTADWKLTARHLGKHADTRSVEDILARIDADPDLNRPGAGSIFLVHDQTELFDSFRRIVDHLAQKGFAFAPVPQPIRSI